jgi:hypothetical protein
VVAKHRRSEPGPWLGSAGAPVSTAGAWPGAAGQAAYARVLPAASDDPADYPAPDGYDAAGPSTGGYGTGGYGTGGPSTGGPSTGGYGPGGYDGSATDPGWAAADQQSWENWRDPREWGPLPELHPDHPSAPVPRVRLPAGHPSGPMPAARAAGGPGLPVRAPRTGGAAPRMPDAGDGSGHRRLHAVPSDPATAYHRETGPLRPLPEPPAGWFEANRAPGRDSPWTAGQVVPLGDSRAAHIAQEAQAYAAAVREAAEREAAAITERAAADAAAIREAAEREAAERRAGLDTMTGELSRVAAYVTESLGAPAMPATAPPLTVAALAPPVAAPAPPATRPAGPGLRPVRPAASPGRPATRPGRPGTSPAKPGARPAKPGARPAVPAGPATVPARQPQKPTRQHQAMRVASYATATLMAFAVLTGATEIGLHGFKFFVFRGGGVGQTAGSETDQQFLARQAAPHHVAAPKGRHARG